MIWKQVKYRGRHYTVSDTSRVKDVNGKTLQKYWKGDYKAVYGGIPVKDLVALAFCKGYKKGKEVNHIDGVKSNDRASNLEWTTHQENVIHAINSGLIIHTRGRLPAAVINDIKENPNDAMEKYNISYVRLCKIIGRQVVCR